MKKYYAGIGSRIAPNDVLIDMIDIAKVLEQKGFILRSGGAKGADQAFEQGVINKDNKEIYTVDNFKKLENYNLAIKSVDIFHPHPEALKPYPRELMARNYMQLFGGDKTSKRSSFVICWTPNGKLIGGTAQAIRIALKSNIPVYNLATVSKLSILKEINSLLL